MSLGNIKNTDLILSKQWYANFPTTDKNKVVISQQTYEGFKITVTSITTGGSLDIFIQIFLTFTPL